MHSDRSDRNQREPGASGQEQRVVFPRDGDVPTVRSGPSGTLARIKFRVEDALNSAGFGLRQRVAFRRPGYREGGTSAERIAALPSPFPARERLIELAPKLANATFDAVLFFVELLTVAIARAERLPGAVDALDVGAKNFESSLGIHAALTALGHDVRLTGSEVDAFRVYDTLHSRCDAAEYYLSLLPSSTRGPHRYLPGDVLQLRESFDLVTWVHPFLSVRPLLAWGLPKRLLMPERMLDHVLDRVRPGGLLMIVNQEEYEARIQGALLDARGVARQSFVHDLVHSRRQPRAYIHLVGG